MNTHSKDDDIDYDILFFDSEDDQFTFESTKTSNENMRTNFSNYCSSKKNSNEQSTPIPVQNEIQNSETNQETVTQNHFIYTINTERANLYQFNQNPLIRRGQISIQKNPEFLTHYFYSQKRKIKYGTGIESLNIQRLPGSKIPFMKQKCMKWLITLNNGKIPSKITVLKNLDGFFRSVPTDVISPLNIRNSRRNKNFLFNLISENESIIKPYLEKNWKYFND